MHLSLGIIIWVPWVWDFDRDPAHAYPWVSKSCLSQAYAKDGLPVGTYEKPVFLEVQRGTSPYIIMLI
jgi:hypothetical protein